ncbi:MAG: hypothetical protein IPO07_20780 [Haliscomenobacter sp.]|nr:hypothetical protein [Haliscomenobacter sp.]MBK9490951.1 hypothetical protein [Haliscomenobacter sp.]
MQDSFLFFTASDGQRGQQLWKTNGTSEGTLLVTNNNAISGVGSILAKLSDTLFFLPSMVLGEELWITDGTNEGTRFVKDIAPGQFGSNPRNGIIYKNKFYFNASDATSGSELWRSDGSLNGTVCGKDIAPGSSSIPYNLTVHNNELFS